ncbi:MAG: hypothetical protein JNK60_04605, partial [Acidobacteria bacterium]|nr:hypothetical protein [Acidobacteriota bacterium]
MRRGLAVFDRLGRAQLLRGAVSLVQLVALLVTSLVLPIPQAEAQSDPWALTPGLTARAVFSCDDLTLNNASSADSAPDAGQGHVGTNGRIALNAASTVLGNATPGPGKAVVRTGGSTVSGSTAPASLAVPCAPVSLTGLASTLPGSNANATIPRTAQNRDPLSGPNRTVFSMTSGDTLQLAAGTYYFTRFTLAGAAKVSVAGPVRIFVAGEIQLGGGSWLNQSGNPANVRLFGNGPRLELTASSELSAFVYVPAAQVDLTNQSRIVGGLWARRATLNASRITKRTALSAPTLTITEPAEGATLPNLAAVAVSGVAQDAEGPVTLTLNGQTVSVGANGVFTATLDLSSTQPPAITAVAADGDGF